MMRFNLKIERIVAPEITSNSVNYSQPQRRYTIPSRPASQQAITSVPFVAEF